MSAKFASTLEALFPVASDDGQSGKYEPVTLHFANTTSPARGSTDTAHEDINTEATTMRVPKTLLVLISPVFARMFESECIEATSLTVRIEKFSRAAFSKFLQLATYLEGDDLFLEPYRFSDDDLSDLVPIAHYYMNEKALGALKNFVEAEPTLDRVLVFVDAGMQCEWGHKTVKELREELFTGYQGLMDDYGTYIPDEVESKARRLPVSLIVDAARAIF